MTNNGVFCLEGEWDPNLRLRDSVQPVLELLERLGQLKSIHRDAATIGEVEYYLKKWSQKGYHDFPVLYLATHGSPGVLHWGPKQDMTLETLAESLGGAARGRYIYLGSCLTLFNERQVRKFVDATGVKAVLGYRKSVDWIESAAFDVILLSTIANHTGTPATLFKALTTRHGELAALLKFVVGTKAEVLHANRARVER